ncbi:MAG: heme-binding protein [Mycobacterium sp.]
MTIARRIIRRGALGFAAAAVLCGVATAIVVLPHAKGEPTPTPTPTPTDAATATPTTTATATPSETPTSTATPTTTATPAAAADPCGASNLTETISKVNHEMSLYLQAHPDTNAALADVARQSPFAAQSAFSAYFDAHPQEATDLRTMQQPLVDLSNQCGYQVTPGQVLGALSDL